MDSFGLYAEYYDALYRDKNYSAEVAFIASKLQKYAPGASSILDLGCGTGLHALELAETGYRVRGVDISKSMLQVANARRNSRASEVAARISFTQGDMRTFSEDSRFDVVTSLFHVMSYQITDEDVENCIVTARHHLDSGAPFVFDFWHGPAVYANNPSARQKVVEDDSLRIVRNTVPEWVPTRHVVRVRYDITVLHKANGLIDKFSEDHTLRYFFIEELDNFLRRGGFELEFRGGWLTDQHLTEQTFGAYVVAIAS